MTNRLRKLGLAGLAALAFAGCNYVPFEHMEGKFRGYETMVDKHGDTVNIKIVAPGYFLNVLKGSAINNGTNFGYITLSASDTSGLLPNSPLFKYANSDSLNVAYDSVIVQTLAKEERIK